METECVGEERTQARLMFLIQDVEEFLSWAQDLRMDDQPFYDLQESLAAAKDENRRWYRANRYF